jgi:hypothetical protein
MSGSSALPLGVEIAKNGHNEDDTEREKHHGFD